MPDFAERATRDHLAEVLTGFDPLGPARDAVPARERAITVMQTLLLIVSLDYQGEPLGRFAEGLAAEFLGDPDAHAQLNRTLRDADMPTTTWVRH